MGLQHLKNRLGKVVPEKPPEKMVIVMPWVPDHMRVYLNDESRPFILREDPTLKNNDLVVTPGRNPHAEWDKLQEEAQNATPDIETPDSTND